MKQIIIGIFIGILCIVGWLYFLDFDEVIHHFDNLDLRLVVLALIVYFAAYFVRSMRWKIILDPIVKLNPFRIFALFISGMFLNYLIPIRLGEVAKSIFLKNTKKIPISKSLPTIFINKIMDLFPIFFLFILLPFVPFKFNKTVVILFILLFIAFVILAVMMILSLTHREWVTAILKKTVFWIPAKFKTLIDKFITKFVESVAVVHHRNTVILEMIGMTIISIILDAAYFYLLFRAFGYNINPLIAFYGYTLLNLSYILPSPPAQLGSQEIFSLAIFAYALGVNKNLVGAVFAFSHIFTGIAITCIGIVSLSIVGVSIKDALDFRMQFNQANKKIKGDK